MKIVLLVSLSTLFLTGCVYERSPYGYSRYTTVGTPIYQEHYYIPRSSTRYIETPSRRSFGYDNHPRFFEKHRERPHFREHHHHW